MICITIITDLAGRATVLFLLANIVFGVYLGVMVNGFLERVLIIKNEYSRNLKRIYYAFKFSVVAQVYGSWR
jgi:hypothetical protein